MHTSIRLWYLVWGVMTFSALADWSPKLTKSCTPCTYFVGNNWRFHRDVSWMLNHRKTQKLSKCSKLVQISKLGFIFSLWGFWVWTGLLPVLTQKRHHLHQHLHHHHPVNQPHLCVPSESADWESGGHH